MLVITLPNIITLMLQSTKVRLNLVRDMRIELEQRWSPRERKLPPGPAGPLYALLL